MKTKVSSIMASGSFLVTICAALVYSASLVGSAPADLLSSSSSSSTMTSAEVGTDPIVPTMVPLHSNEDKPWQPQKPSRSKHIIKSNLYKKPSKDKGISRAKQQQQQQAAAAEEKHFYSPTLVSTGYDVEKDNLSSHKEATSSAVRTTPTDTAVDNANGPNDYTNKTTTNSTTLHQSTTESSVFRKVDDDDDDNVAVGKDIDFISVAGTTKADQTYATASTTSQGYHSTRAASSTAATMQTGLVENPNSNAETIAKMSTASILGSGVHQDINSISASTSSPPDKSLPVDASVSSSSLSLSFSQHSTTTASSLMAVAKLDVGHDGVKVTKKKQLFDKHFIAATPASGSLHPAISKDNSWPKRKPEKGGKKLMEVPNGYLGPIMMKEKTFSVSHHGKKPKPSIAEQLKDRKLVEIIAPTALMEPTMRVKSSVSPPEFVPVERVSSTTTAATTTSTERASTPVPSVKSITTSKKKAIDAETVTTYFLVATEDTKTSTEAANDKTSEGSTASPRKLKANGVEEVEASNYTTEAGKQLMTTEGPPPATEKSLDSTKPLELTPQESAPDLAEKNPTLTNDPITTTLPTMSMDSETLGPFLAISSGKPSVTEDHVTKILDNGSTEQSLRSGAPRTSTFSIPSRPMMGKKSSTIAIDSSTITDHTTQIAPSPEVTNEDPFAKSITTMIGSTDSDSTPHVFATETPTQPISGISPSKITDQISVATTLVHGESVTQTSDLPSITLDPSKIAGRDSSDTDRADGSAVDHLKSTSFSQSATITDSRVLELSGSDLSVTPCIRSQAISQDQLKTTFTQAATITDRPVLELTDSDLSVRPSSPLMSSAIPTDRSSTSACVEHHDSSAGTSSTPIPVTDAGPTFTTITADSLTPTSTHQQTLKPNPESEQRESRISDIQIEVYDSTIEPILASTNFKDNANKDLLHTTTKESPRNSHQQERFTQYVVDKTTDLATQDSNSVGKASGKPEPAAIEIHINVSEGFGNESEDLEFSYRQPDYRKVSNKNLANPSFITLKPFEVVPQNETSNEAAEEIVVEIIDANSNSTENSASRENLNVNPIFTFRSDDDAQVELKNVKYYPEDKSKEGSKSTDDFFVPHVGQPASGANKPLMDRDSDTIFYISNTEVKVGESLPTTNTYDAMLKKSRLESQFFPASYEERKKLAPQRYEEDIILSPAKNTLLDPLKLVRGPLDISYVGESVMEVEQVTITTTAPPPITPDVIIQPAVLPEMAIGVPVIGELPPQIELKEIDFMPNFDGNREESSIQYGGDLIDEGGAMGVGFDMDSYPLGNLGLGQKNDAIPSQMLLNHRVNHLKKDELSADLAASSETADGNDLLRRSNESVNGTVIGEKMGNATAYSVMEEPPAGDRGLHFTDLHTLFTACLATLLPLILSVVIAFGLRHLYRKYQTNPFNVMGRNSSTDPLDAEKGNGGEEGGEADGIETPEELRASSLAFGATTDSPSLAICPHSNEANSNASSADGRDCNGIVANGGGGGGAAAASHRDVDCIQAIIMPADDVQEENATFIGNCNIEGRRPTAPPATPPQSNTINTQAAGAAAATLAGGTMPCNYSGANGSITTMTLKNNHLIVETEERNDISRDARVTKMHYNNSEKDGVFVVEVSRGADSKIMPGSPVADPADKRPFGVDSSTATKAVEQEKPLSSHEEVQVHPPPPENVNTQDDAESTHLHQIEEVDEFEEGPKIAKHSNTGLSQSDLSSSSSVDSNKRYSYGNQELYTIEQQDYNTPSPAATKAPHPHAEAQRPQPENHNDDNGHSENGLDNGSPTTPNGDAIHPADADSDVNGHGGVESKPKITAALLKQDTVIVNELTNGTSHNGNEDDDVTPHNSMENLSNGRDAKTADFIGDTENGFDSIISLPDPPSTEEIKQMNDIILMDSNQLDSLPPPPPPGAAENNHHRHTNGNGSTTENGDTASIGSSDAGASPMNTPIKLMVPTAPPTITVAADIPHTNGNCMMGHSTNASNAAIVEVSGSS